VLLERLTAGGSLADLAPRVLELALPAHATSPGEARAAFRVYAQANDLSTDLVDSGLLVISELVTNALLHAETPVLVWAEYDAGHLTLAAVDGSSTLPVLSPFPDGHREGGRGMAIVDELGATWGLIRTALGKIIWVDLVAEAIPAVPGQRATSPRPDAD
jgi:anti-sigma regulatory factor (Ser/Thr protein kinase)